MQASQLKTHQKSSNSHIFSPFLSNTLKIQGTFDFSRRAVCFSPRHNMIIACPRDCTMQFYDATTLLPIKERETFHLDHSPHSISFHPETDTYLIGCTESIYLYHASNNELKKVKDCENYLAVATFVNSSCYAFSLFDSPKLFLGTFGNENVMSFRSRKGDVYCLHHLTRQNLLLSGLDSGSVVIYRTDKLPRLPVFCSVQARQAGMSVLAVQDINVNGKEYIITASRDKTVKIWHLVKGRMRLLKVLWTKGVPDSVVYLENHKILVIGFESSESNEIELWRFASGKLERTVWRSDGSQHHLFLMKEKNMVGITSWTDSVIELFQLGLE